MSGRQLRVALVGCGQIADAHLHEIRKLGFAKLAAVADRHLDLARQAAARFEVPQVFEDLERMLDQVRPDVLHVTTPPHTHRDIALRALAAGSHVYVEKPFTVNVAEADEVLNAARSCQRLICVGHDQLYDPSWEECRELARRGTLGKVVHVEAVHGYDPSGPFGLVSSADPEHWVHRLPGGVFQNIISHGLYTIADFLPDAQPRVWARWFELPSRAAYPTELRVLLCGAEVSGTLMSTSTVRPVLRLTRVYGTRQCVEVDFDGRVLRRYQVPGVRGPFIKLETPWRHLCEGAGSLRRNLGRLLRADLHFFAGMNRLFTRFYRAILEGGAPPIPYAEIRRVTALMDQIFRSCRSEQGTDPRPASVGTSNPTEASRKAAEGLHEGVGDGSDGVSRSAPGPALDAPGNFGAVPRPADQ
jgi:predicted dehydrogenase